MKNASKPTGITSEQRRVLEQLPGVPKPRDATPSSNAGLDRTIEVLVRRELIEYEPGSVVPPRRFRLTAAGNAILHPKRAPTPMQRLALYKRFLEAIRDLGHARGCSFNLAVDQCGCRPYTRADLARMALEGMPFPEGY